MLTLKIELIANRYHANPWNRAHVEGVVEWPPSPWRLLRAILSGSYAGGVETDEVRPVVQLLSECLPTYYLPAGAYLQTRSPRKDRSDTDRLFKMGKDVCDASFNFDASDRTIWVQWPVSLSEQQLLMLSRCVAYCRYLGRREADAIWSLADAEEMSECNAYPDEAGTTAVACSDGDIDALVKSAYHVQAAEKRAVFPGLRWCNYCVVALSTKGITAPSLTYRRAELAIRSAGKIQAMSVPFWAEKLHKTLSKLGSPNFTGCDATGAPLTSHEHVFIQPRLVDEELVGFELFCAAGFSEDELAYLHNKVRKLYGGKSEISVRVTGLFADMGVAAQVWESQTPFFLTRWPLSRNGKPRLIAGTAYQKDGAEHQALKSICYLPQMNLNPKECEFEAGEGGLAMLKAGRLIAIASAEPWVGAWQWQCDRSHGKKVGDTGYRIRLYLSQPCNGPMAIGYSAHYGMGVLRARVGVQMPILLEAAQTTVS